MSIADERASISRALGPLLDASADEVEAAILLVYERSPPQKRNLVSVLATADHLRALLAAISGDERRALLAKAASGIARRDRALEGELDRVAVAISDELAGPFAIAWDGNWPSARPRLRSRIPVGVRAGDVIIGGDGGGTRIDLAVIEDDDGVLTGVEMPNTWRDPPLEEVWVSTYQRLEHLYPNEVPPSVRRAYPGKR